MEAAGTGADAGSKGDSLALPNRRAGIVVGIGDAENDQAFLSGCAVAVANALPSVKEKADFVVADHSAGRD